MTATDKAGGYKLYWMIWGILLALTVVMLFLDNAPMPRVAFVLIMVGAMLAKAFLIAGYFMHLRYEALFIRLSVLIGLLVNGAVLYFLIIPDAYRILGMS
jgi:caa(3)-type oxidase subunit IV